MVNGYLSGARCRLAYSPADAHCHSLSLASVKSRLVLPFWYRLTRVVPEKWPWNARVCVCVSLLLDMCFVVWHQKCSFIGVLDRHHVGVQCWSLKRKVWLATLTNWSPLRRKSIKVRNYWSGTHEARFSFIYLYYCDTLKTFLFQLAYRYWTLGNRLIDCFVMPHQSPGMGCNMNDYATVYSYTWYKGVVESNTVEN